MFTQDYNNNLTQIKNALRSDQSFDLVERDIIICNRHAALFFVDGFVKDDIIEKILEYFYKNLTEENFKSPEFFSLSSIPYVEVETSDDVNKICTNVLSGVSALVIDGLDNACLFVPKNPFPKALCCGNYARSEPKRRGK